MPNKKINQLDTRTGAALSDLILIGDPTSGTSFKLTATAFRTLLNNVPYTGATTNVNLGAFNLTAASIIRTGGTSSQFLKADGSVDSSTYTPTSRTLTINGTAFDLSADRSWTVSSDNIYTANGTLSADRTVTSNGNSLTILGGKELAAAEQTALILQTSATNKTTVELNLNNTFTTTGKSWRLRSLSTGAFDIATGVTRAIYFGSDAKVVVNGSASIASAQFSVSGSIATNSGLQIQGDINTPSGAGIELVYSGGTSYFTSYNRTSSAWLPIIIRGSQIDLTTAGTTRARITAAGRLLLGTTTEGTDLLLVNGTARVNDNLLVSKSQNDITSISINNGNGGSNSSSRILFDSAACQIISAGSGYTTYKTINAFDYAFYKGGNGDIVFQHDQNAGKIRFTAGGASTTQMTLTAAGRLLLGTTNESTFLLDVNGTARASQLTLTGSASIALLIGSEQAIRVNSNSGTLYIDAGLNLAGTINMRATSVSVSSALSSGSLSTNNVNTGTAAGGTGLQIASQYVLNLKSTGDVLRFNDNTTYTNVGMYGNGYQISNSTAPITMTFNSSALLELNSATKGFLPPRLTTTQKNAIGTPAAGLQVYDTTLNQMSYYNGTTWINF
jgi:hypothetical protein